MTTFGDMIFQMGGVPVWPQIPFGRISKAFFVDPVNGSDSYNGRTRSRPVKTLSKAHDLCTANNNDVVFLMANGLTSGTARLDEQLTWSKDATHLIGIAAPNHVAQRARISATSGVSNIATMVQISGDNCFWSGIHIFQNFSSDAANIALELTGERCAFHNCHIAGGGNATGADNAGMRSLKITGGAGLGEHYFKNCVIGLDTVSRGSAASAEIELDGGSPRNRFEDCWITAYTDGASHRLLTIGTGGIDRWLHFKRCVFWGDTIGGGTQMTELLDVPADVGGTVLLDNCSTYNGASVEGTNHGRVFISQETDTVADALAV